MRCAPLLRMFAALLFLHAPAMAQPVEMLVFPNAGMFEEGATGEVTGAGVKVLTRLGELAAVSMKLQSMPPARALITLGQNTGSCAAGVPRTPQREALFRWVGLAFSGSIMLYGRADDRREVSDLASLRGTVIAAQRESQPLNWLREQSIEAYVVNDTATGLRMLRAGRVDYWLVNDLVGQLAVQQLPPPRPRALRSFGRIDLYIACHRDFPEATAERLRATLEQMRRNGELAEVGLR